MQNGATELGAGQATHVMHNVLSPQGIHSIASTTHPEREAGFSRHCIRSHCTLLFHILLLSILSLLSHLPPFLLSNVLFSSTHGYKGPPRTNKTVQPHLSIQCRASTPSLLSRSPRAKRWKAKCWFIIGCVCRTNARWLGGSLCGWFQHQISCR